MHIVCQNHYLLQKLLRLVKQDLPLRKFHTYDITTPYKYPTVHHRIASPPERA